MAGNKKRLDLVERAAEKLDGPAASSLVEKAAAKAADALASGAATADAVIQTAGDAHALDAGGDEAAASPPTRHSQRRVNLDLVKLQLEGFITPHCEPVRIAEEFRVLKRPLLIKAFAQGNFAIPNGHLIMVTSAKPGEGKTFTSLNLAMSIASEPDLNVLLVDADIHKPGLVDWLGIEADRGLVDLLADTSIDLTDVLIRTNIPNLTILPSGTSYPQAPELLASQRMVEFTRDIATRYSDRVVIFDAPPVLASSEPGVLALHTGQIVFVVEANRTSHRAVEEALGLISTCQNISFVLNQTSFRVGSDRFGSYSYHDYLKR